MLNDGNAKEGIEPMVDRIGTHEITAPKLAATSDFGQNDFEAFVKAASDKESSHSSAASRKNGAQTGKPDDGGKPTGDELARKTIEAQRGHARKL